PTSNTQHPMGEGRGVVVEKGWLSRSVAWVLISLVRIYQVTLSPAKMFIFGAAGECRFEPSCSKYAVEALKIHGPLKGSWLAGKRICRCHPWSECGEDPVPGKFQVPSSKFQVGGVESKVSSAQSTVSVAAFRV